MIINEKKARQEWRTPQNFLAAIAREWSIDIDVSASAENSVVPRFYGIEQDGLKQPWFDSGARVAWCNPGFRSQGDWTVKAKEETRANPGCTALVMTTVSPSAQWWALAEACAVEIRLLAPRVQFEPAPGIIRSSNAHENALFIFRYNCCYHPTHVWRWKWR
jgi:phage N-6-adenine-methyltransferase